MNKKELLQELIDTVREIPISSIVEKRIDIYPRGNSTLAYCPWHDDGKLGSFVITDSKGIWKCFACQDRGGDGPKFIAMYDNISYIEAVLRIAVEFELIDDSQAKKLTRNSKTYNINDFVKKEFSQKEETPKADIQTIHFVYSILTKGAILEGKSNSLSKEHHQYLNDRGIDDNQIERNDYFTFSNRKSIKKIVELLRKRGLEETSLIGVPGFYYDKKNSCIAIASVKGIGIPIKNAKGKIVGIQIRRDSIKEGQSRYVWFSSSFASLQEDCDLGTAPGAPIDICYPEEVTSNKIYITEGHFKADVLASHYESCALSVQGIGNWKNIEKTIEEVGRNLKNPIKEVYIAFDADLSQNLNVGMQALKMAQHIESKVPSANIYFLLWDDNIAKGIDDLLAIESGEAKIKKVSKKDFEERYNLLLFKLMQRLEVLKPSDISREMVAQYGRDETKPLIKKSFDKLVFSKF